MTSPQIIQVPGVGAEIQQAIAPLLAALQFRQKMALDREELALRQKEIESQGELRGAETAKIRRDLQTQEKALKAREKAGVQFAALATSPTGLSDATGIAAARAALGSDADAQSALDAMLQEALQSGDAAAKARQTANVEAMRTKVQPFVDRLLRDPDARLPTKDISVGQAVAAEQLGILGLIRDSMENERQRAGVNAQGDMLLRQSVVDAYRRAAEERQRISEDPMRPPTTAIPGVRELVPQFLPEGVTPEEAKAIYDEVVEGFFRTRGGRPRPLAQPAGLERLQNNAFYKSQPSDVQQQLIDAAYGVAQGRQLAENLPPSARAWIRAAAGIIQRRGSTAP